MFKFANRMRRGATYHASVFLSEACMSKSSTLLIGLSVPIVYSRSFQSTALCTAAAAAAVTSPSSTVVETDSGSGRMKIYQYKICPFCNRVKTYLDFLQIEYDTVEVNPVNKAEITFPVVSKKVPIAIVDRQVVEDSKNIIDLISTSLVDGSSRDFNKTEFFIDSEKWTEWSEKELAILLYPNITRSFSESKECFDYANDVESWTWIQKFFIQYIGAVGMVFANGKIKKKYNIVDERKELQQRIDVWLHAIKGKKFLHGDNVSLSDLVVFGVLKSISGLSTFNELMSKNQELKEWYGRVDEMTPSFEKGNSYYSR